VQRTYQVFHVALIQGFELVFELELFFEGFLLRGFVGLQDIVEASRVIWVLRRGGGGEIGGYGSAGSGPGVVVRGGLGRGSFGRRGLGTIGYGNGRRGGGGGDKARGHYCW